MTGVWHLRTLDKYGMSVYGSRKGAPAQAIYMADRWRKGHDFFLAFSCHICFAHTNYTVSARELGKPG